MKNKKLSTINGLNVISVIIELIVVFIIAYYHRDWRFWFDEACIALAAYGVINFAFILVREICIFSYDSKRFTTIMCIAHTFFAVLLYYVDYFLNQNEIPFDNYSVLLWSLLFAALVVPLVIFPILNHFYGTKAKNDKPKFIVNK